MKIEQPDIYIQAVLSGETNSLVAILDKSIEALALADSFYGKKTAVISQQP